MSMQNNVNALEEIRRRLEAIEQDIRHQSTTLNSIKMQITEKIRSMLQNKHVIIFAGFVLGFTVLQLVIKLIKLFK
jgi:hypothetical protein